MTDELRVCPFCGSEPEVFEGFNPALVQCVNPDCIAAEFDGMEIDKWNDRPIEAALSTELQQAKEEIKEIQHGFEIQQTTYVNLLEKNKKLQDDVEHLQHFELLVTECGFEVETVLGRECLHRQGVEYYPERKE